MRRFLFSLLIIALIVALVGIIWFFFIKKDTTGGTVITPPGDTLGQGNTIPGQNGTGGIISPPDIFNPGSTTPPFASSSVPLLEKVWDKPVAGQAFIFLPIIITSTSTDKKGQEILIQKKATSSLLYFVEKESGNIYKKDLDKGTIERVTNTTIPEVWDAYFLENGSYVVMRTYNTRQKSIQTFIAPIPKTITGNDPGPLSGSVFIQNNIISLLPSLDSKTLYYLVGGNGSSVYAWSKTKGSQILSTLALKELLLSVTSQTVLATTKASAFVKGYLFTATSFVNLYGGKTGLTTNTSPSGVLVLSSMWTNSGLSLFIHSLVDGKDRILSIKTLAEKCSWNKYSTFALCGVPDFIERSSFGLPDDWYQGEVHFRDSLYLIGMIYPTETKLVDLSSLAGTDIDLINGTLSPSTAYFSFINKNDSLLWLLHTDRVLTGEQNN